MASRTRPHASARTASRARLHLSRRVDAPSRHLDQLAAARGHLVPRLAITSASRTSSGVIARHRPARAGAPERPERQLRAASSASARSARRAAAPRPLPRHPDQRVLDPRSRAGVRAAHPARPRPKRRWWTGASTPGAASTRRGTPTTRCRPEWRWSSDLPVFHPGIVMEGGAVDFNGDGTLLTTTSCLLNKNRNPGCRSAEIERYLKRLLRPAARRLAGRGHRGRRHRRPRRRPGALRRRAD